MALTYSPEAQLGSECPKFRLPLVQGGFYSLEDATIHKPKALVFVFICNHCPYVRAIEDRILALAKELQTQGAQFIAICANDPSDYSEDSPAQLLQRWQDKKYPFPYLIDSDQEVAKSFGAVCTPDFFVYDQSLKLSYRGRLDDSWRNSALVRRQELRQAVLDLISGNRPSPTQNPSMGCSIKWKKG